MPKRRPFYWRWSLYKQEVLKKNSVLTWRKLWQEFELKRKRPFLILDRQNTGSKSSPVLNIRYRILDPYLLYREKGGSLWDEILYLTSTSPPSSESKGGKRRGSHLGSKMFGSIPVRLGFLRVTTSWTSSRRQSTCPWPSPSLGGREQAWVDSIVVCRPPSYSVWL